MVFIITLKRLAPEYSADLVSSVYVALPYLECFVRLLFHFVHLYSLFQILLYVVHGQNHYHDHHHHHYHDYHGHLTSQER